MKKALIIASTCLSILAPGIIHAQAPVFDVKNFQQSLQQVAAWKKQYNQMLQQHQQLVAQQRSMTGNRGLGHIADDPRLRAVVPHDIAKTYDSIRGKGAGSLTSAAQSIRAATQIYTCADRTGQDRSTCEASLNITSQTQAFQQQAMQLLTQRRTQIQTLQAQINATNDPKSTAELQARLQVEAAQVSNDANRLSIMHAMASSADRAAQQALKERELHNLSLKSDGTDTFVYKPFSGR